MSSVDGKLFKEKVCSLHWKLISGNSRVSCCRSELWILPSGFVQLSKAINKVKIWIKCYIKHLYSKLFLTVQNMKSWDVLPQSSCIIQKDWMFLYSEKSVCVTSWQWSQSACRAHEVIRSRAGISLMSANANSVFHRHKWEMRWGEDEQGGTRSHGVEKARGTHVYISGQMTEAKRCSMCKKIIHVFFKQLKRFKVCVAWCLSASAESFVPFKDGDIKRFHRP